VCFLRHHGDVPVIGVRPLRTVVSVLALLGARQAGAAELPDLSLGWQAPAGCPDQDALLTRVAELLGARGGQQSHEPLDVSASVLRLPSGFRAELRTTQRGAERIRTLEAATCSEVTEASAVVIALALSPPEPTVAPPAPLPPPAPAPAPAEASDAPPPPAGLARRSSVRLGAGAGFVSDVGTLAPVSFGFAFGLGARYGRYVEHGLRLSVFPTRSASIEGHPEQGVDIGLAAAALSLCFEPLSSPLTLGVCGELELGMLHVEGFGTPDRFSHDAPWVAPGLGLRAGYPEKGPLRAALTADALFPTEQTKFTITNLGVVHELPVVSGRFGLFAELVFL
jgi:hypothetical protein